MSKLSDADCAVRQLHARYIDAVWRHDAQAFGDCWTQDAKWKIIGSELNGREAIVALWAQVMANFKRVIQFYHPPILEIGDRGCFGRTYVTEHNMFNDGRKAFTIGLYHESYRDEGDRWRFTWRHFDLFYMGPPDLSGRFFDIPDYGPPPRHPDPTRPASPPADKIF
jgi:ketosteroid isomerase-like protein